MNIKEKIIFVLIILLATVIRVVDLDKIPPNLGNDEISIAYDGYSISKTLRDEHNHFLPISFQSHNTYKAPLTIYTVALSTMVFGNNEYGARLPSAIFGILTILLVGLLVFELTKNAPLCLITSFMLAISPWHIYSSRLVWETNIALFFVVAGIFCFYKGLHNKNNVLTLLSFVSFALSMYGYHTEWVFTPVLIFVLLLLNFNNLRNKLLYIPGLILFIVLIAPLGIDYIQNLGTSARSNTEVIYSKIFNNIHLNIFQKIQLLFSTFIANYSEYTNLGHLFFRGSSIPSDNNPLRLGLFLPIFLPLFFVGLLKFKKIFKQDTSFILFFLVFSPVVPALTSGGPVIARNLISTIPYSILIAVGVYFLWQRFKPGKLQLATASVLVVISLLYFMLLYFRSYPIESALGFQYGYKQIALYIKSNYSKYERIVVDPKFGDLYQYDGVPHLYIAYFTNLDPQKFLDERKDLPSGLYFDKYIIHQINWPIEQISPGNLYIVPTSNLPTPAVLEQLNLVYEVRMPSGIQAFKIYESLN